MDQARLSFDLEVDLTPAFHWNTKMLFVYVVAIYETAGRTNQVVLWDKIVEADKPKYLKEINTVVDYPLKDQRWGVLRGKDVTLQLQWVHVPITGFFFLAQQPMDSAYSFSLPTEYL